MERADHASGLAMNRRGIARFCAGLIAMLFPAGVRAATAQSVRGTEGATGVLRVDDHGMTLAERTIPWPQSISPQARAALQAAARRPAPPFPDPSDSDGWRNLVAQIDRDMAAYLPKPDPTVTVVTETLAGATVHRARPHALDVADRRLYIDIHGGGLVSGGGDFCKAGAVREAALHGVEVLSIDYRMPPGHRYPVALDDCFAVYAAEVKRRGADRIIVGGGSAGGYLTAALMLRARDAGLPLPRAALLLSPRVDMTESGDTVATLMDIDPVLKGRLAATALLYAGGHDLRDPYLSPLFGDLKGLPPTLLQSGTRDLYLSNTVRMHRALRKAGVAAQLHVFEAMPHGRFFGGAPEDAALDQELKAFVSAHWQPLEDSA
ncbi:acetyl esterase/lipase [Sphingobium sp. OAS761]|uniref:alpha/beta hydrolase fold domain-containing protein n=1 Tax=Sphingobium sp. OAS761 TaxID=2817901 RepID=UPI0020A17171|nr:alpha/beta hydrolase fold domain-containing protein [Sphingobium sp. OAS761]MCP1470388.1 acetyl esterase/lipase [Sphingobium sp. OAS761]